jgi:hypothetical protein
MNEQLNFFDSLNLRGSLTCWLLGLNYKKPQILSKIDWHFSGRFQCTVWVT